MLVRCKRASGHNQPKDKPKSAVLSLCFLFVIGLLPSGSADEMSCGWSSLLACCLWRSALITHNQKRRKAAQFSHFPPRFIVQSQITHSILSFIICSFSIRLGPPTKENKPKQSILPIRKRRIELFFGLSSWAAATNQFISHKDNPFKKLKFSFISCLCVQFLIGGLYCYNIFSFHFSKSKIH